MRARAARRFWNMKKKFKFLAADVAECAMFVALMTVCTLFVQIPFYPVPLTFQTVTGVLAGLLLGKTKGALSMACYCLLGLVGAPVFSGLGGGIYSVFKPTFGYILGFIASAYVAGLISGKGKGFSRYALAAFAAFLADYIFGIAYFAVIWQFWLKMPDLGHYVVIYNLLYMPKDFVLCGLAALLAYKVAPIIKRGKPAKALKENAPQ